MKKIFLALVLMACTSKPEIVVAPPDNNLNTVICYMGTANGTTSWVTYSGTSSEAFKIPPNAIVFKEFGTNDTMVLANGCVGRIKAH